MSGVKLTLRPPPNVDFVTGYPGIPPGQDRPQAAVKGAIEVRTPPSGVKAQWVRIELRKVETLPGGGDANTFTDYVGPSPVTVWNAPDEYNVLRAQDFPFAIRIPESIPPSIALEGRAGIQYELVATVCTKGKRSFLRKRKNIVTKEIAPVTIDKHELHSTWPVYCQPESRQLVQDGVTLVVERSHTCYGPGDRISVVATLKSDSLHTVILRGFEMTLKESTIFRGHTFGAARKAPLVKSSNVAEMKLAVNATLYGGSMHHAELACQLPPNHTTTTLNAARHIDVTYVLSVKALMGTGAHVTMDLPVIVSNWQRYVSIEAIRRIGTAPALSLVPVPVSTAQSIISVEPTSPPRTMAPTTPSNTLPPSSHARSPSGGDASQYNTAQTNISGRPGTANTITDEFGYGVGVGYGNKSVSPYNSIFDSKISQDSNTIAKSPSASTINTTNNAGPGAGKRTSSARSVNPANRFTITNVAESEIPEEASVASLASNPRSPVPTNAKRWPTAEEEKRAYESARTKVVKLQGTAAAPAPAPSAVPQSTRTPPPAAQSSAANSGRPWLSAAEEKVLLYEKAQAAVDKAQRSADGRSSNLSLSSVGSGSKPSGSELYQQAMANVQAHQNANTSRASSTYVSPLAGGARKHVGPGSSGGSGSDGGGGGGMPKVPRYPTAEQEKEALRRYEEARMAVDRMHNPYESNPSAPIAYDSLYPGPGGSSSSSGGAGVGGAGAGADAPPPFEASVTSSNVNVGSMSAMAEKAALAERMRLEEAAAGRMPNQSGVPPPSFNAVQDNIQQQYRDAAAEKEDVRKKLEAKDAAAAAKRARHQQQRQHSLRNQQQYPQPPPPQEAMPQPPSSAQVLTAAEEKARLKAKFEAKDAARLMGQKKVNGMPTPPASPRPQVGSFQAGSTPQGSPSLQQQQLRTPGSPSVATLSPPPPPPPLMPRPPADYIRETREEDERVSKVVIDGVGIEDEGSEAGSGSGSGVGVNGGGGRGYAAGIYMNGNASGSLSKRSLVAVVPGPPPPLPPKPAGE